MAGSITALGTTYNLPNYTGILHQLTPDDTPFFASIGGLSGGGQCTATQFEWETFDLRSAGQNTALEGQDAPTEQNRVRGSVDNIVQIHHETVGVSYSKLAAVGQRSGLNIDANQPVTNELDWQVTNMLKQMVRDVEYSSINGVYQKPTDNTTPRKTRGMLQAVTTNVQNMGTALGNAAGAISTDAFTLAAHGLAAGDQVVLDTIVSLTGVSADTPYFVVSPTTNTFKLAATKNGAAIDLAGADGTANVTKLSAWSKAAVDGLLQQVFDNGGITESETAALVVGSTGKRGLTDAYANAYGKYQEATRNVGGVNLQTIETDFGQLNIMLDRHMPKHKLLVASLEQCMPVYLETPGKGHFFAEPLAKTGSKERTQLYGEVGLAYGNERCHGQAVGLMAAL
ncbi:SU10 major capsid protein [Streptomyces sp. IBSBF 2435]|uniref:SU10 major capsid protein n=1 Tax=Streptomyces sp. IBSBF 2435 TaxID=2903531 RepID=UPI002FDC2D24